MTCQRTRDCWCRDCHALRHDQYDGDNLQTLKNKFLQSIQKEQVALQTRFTQVLNCSAIAKSFKNKLHRFTGYTYVKSYLKQVGYDIEEAQKLAQQINEASWVYDHLDKIIDNLHQFQTINISRLSIRQLYLAKDMDWCFRYVQNLKVGGKKNGRTNLRRK